MKLWKILTLTIGLVSVGLPALAGFTTWLSPGVQTGVLALTPVVAVAIALVLYFNWRARLRNRIAADERDSDWARAA